MSKMSEMHAEITELIDTTHLLCAEIAERVGCPVEWVNALVEERWNTLMSPSENLSPYCTVNS